MNKNELINYLEDKKIVISNRWYFHATTNVNSFNDILHDGIKANILLGRKGQGYNGKYYISLFKYRYVSNSLLKYISGCPKIVVKNIFAFYADNDKQYRDIYNNTLIPFRTSCWDGEYQKFLKVSPNKFCAIEFSLSYLLKEKVINDEDINQKLDYLNKIIMSMEGFERELPLIDLSSKREINKSKVKSLIIK